MNTLSIEELRRLMPKNKDGTDRDYFLAEEYAERVRIAKKTIQNALARELEFKVAKGKRLIRIDAFHAWMNG